MLMYLDLISELATALDQCEADDSIGCNPNWIRKSLCGGGGYPRNGGDDLQGRFYRFYHQRLGTCYHPSQTRHYRCPAMLWEEDVNWQ